MRAGQDSICPWEFFLPAVSLYPRFTQESVKGCTEPSKFFCRPYTCAQKTTVRWKASRSGSNFGLKVTSAYATDDFPISHLRRKCHYSTRGRRAKGVCVKIQRNIGIFFLELFTLRSICQVGGDEKT